MVVEDSIFKIVKKEIDFLGAMESMIGPLKQCGDYNWTTEEDECPLHGGHECFRIKIDEDGENENSYVNCFGNCIYDGGPIDIVEFTMLFTDGIDSMLAAAQKLARDFNIDVPNTYAPKPEQLILNSAAEYYNRGMLDTSKFRCLDDKTPEEYQLTTRHHKKESLVRAGIGWSNGRLNEHLLREGFTRADMLASGLVKDGARGLYDHLPDNSFIYTHKWHGRVSRFTVKNHNGKKYQMTKKNWLNDIVTYVVGEGNPVAIVEGENDLISMLDAGWPGTVHCINGSLSDAQIKWFCDNPADYCTYFDPDEAGLKYQDKLWKVHAIGKLPSLRQFLVPLDSGDIDNYLRTNSIDSVEEIFTPHEDELFDLKVTKGSVVTMVDGTYLAPKFATDGTPQDPKEISDFTIELLYVKVRNGERSRVIRIHRRDGRSSQPITVDSEAKVSLRHFKILVANAIDASFTGSDSELAAMWSFIYEQQKEAVVDVPDQIGDINKDGWLFGNMYMLPDRDIISDTDNIMWLDERKKSGISPKSLLSALHTTTVSADIPRISRGERSIEGDVLHQIARVLKDPGAAITIMGWLKSCAYSMPLFYDEKVNFFPFLLLWGRHGKGKSTLSNWMLSMYDMANKGTTTVAQLRSGVGIERKLSYYRGLPFCIDEIRADRQSSEFSGTWRGWYNRSSRYKGTRVSEDIVQVPVNACLFFSGQDVFTDPAMRSRCIPIKFPSDAGDDRAYIWLEDNCDLFPTIGYDWVREALETDASEVQAGMRDLQSALSERVPSGVPSRATGNYSYAGYFGMGLAERYFPGYDYMEYMLTAMAGEYHEAQEGDMVNSFFELVAGLQLGDHPEITNNHITVKDNVLYMWYAEVYRLATKASRSAHLEGFSRGAVKDALVEEPYHVGPPPTVRLGPTKVARRCLAFRVNEEDTPHELQSIADTSANNY